MFKKLAIEFLEEANLPNNFATRTLATMFIAIGGTIAGINIFVREFVFVSKEERSLFIEKYTKHTS